MDLWSKEYLRLEKGKGKCILQNVYYKGYLQTLLLWPPCSQGSMHMEQEELEIWKDWNEHLLGEYKNRYQDMYHSIGPGIKLKPMCKKNSIS